MTKEQAYQQADTENLYATDQTNTDIIFRAMEIFAGAFSEWSEKVAFAVAVEDGETIWKYKYVENLRGYPTSQLIAEFEKIENK